MNKKITYLYLLNQENKKDTKVCGYDSEGNKVYFPSNEHCPINYIEFTSSSTLSLNGDYLWTTKQINDNTYTNDYVEGKILVHLRMGIDKLMGEINSYNDICYFQLEIIIVRVIITIMDMIMINMVMN